MVSEFGELVDVAFDSSDEAAHLREDFVYVGRNFGHGARKDVDVVVTIHFELAEFRPEGSIARGGVGEHLRRWSRVLRKRPTRGINPIEFVLFLELGDFALQAFFRKTECVAQALEFSDASEHAGTINDQLSDSVHHAVKARERDANGFCGCGSIRGLAGFWRADLGAGRTAGLHGLSGQSRFRRWGCVFGIHRRDFRDAVEQGIDASAHFGFVGPLFVQSLFQNIDGFQAEIDDLRKRLNFAFTKTADQIFDAVRDAAKTLETYLRRGAFYGVYRTEEFIDFFRTVIGFQGKQTITDDLQMFFGFGLEEFENFGWDFIIFREGVEIGAGYSGQVRRIVR